MRGTDIALIAKNHPNNYDIILLIIKSMFYYIQSHFFYNKHYMLLTPIIYISFDVKEVVSMISISVLNFYTSILVFILMII